MELFKKHPLAVSLSILFHGVLIAFLVVQLDFFKSEPETPPVPVVQAKVVDNDKVQAAVEALKKREMEKELAAKKRLQELEKKRLAEEKQLEQVKQQKIREQQQVEAAKQQKLQAEREAAERKKQVEAERVKQQQVEKKRQAEAARKAKIRAEQEAKKKAEAKRLAEAERKKKLAEQKKKQEAERKRRAEAARQAKLAAEQKAREDALQASLAQELEEQRAQEALTSIRGLIQQHVSRNWITPPGNIEGLSCTVRVRLLPTPGQGEVLSAQVTQSSGNPVFDRSVENATLKASPLPLPSDPGLVKYYRDIQFKFCPGGC